MNPQNWLVIGCGNELRGDDACGPRIAQIVSEWALPHVRALAVHQFTPELAAHLQEVDQVIFVDASLEITRTTLEPITPDEASVSPTTHAGDPLWILGLAQALYGHSPKAHQLLIPVSDFEFGNGLSLTTQRGMEDARECLLQLIRTENVQNAQDSTARNHHPRLHGLGPIHTHTHRNDFPPFSGSIFIVEPTPNEATPENEDSLNRRTFFRKLSIAAMAGGLVASYGTLGGMAAYFLYPASSQKKVWMFVTELTHFKLGDALSFTIPTGQTVTITRQQNKGDLSDFLALSSTCPHLGCEVHWEAQNNRFFCPCHNGAFDPTGKPIAGPPKDDNQALPKYPLRLENGLLFIEVPTE